MARSTQANVNMYVAVSDAITEADTNSTVAVLDVPDETYIPAYGISVYIPEVFAGGTPSLDIGDGTDPDGWVDTTDITETTIGTYGGTEANTAALAQTGKYYSTADTIDAVVSASLTGGTAYVIALMVDCSDLDMTSS